MDRRTFLKTASAAAALAANAQAAPTTRPPNVLFVMADQWRRPAFGYRAEDPVQTPVLDAFAKESMVFTRAYCCAPLCVPSRGGMFTGRYPQSTSIIGRSTIKPDETSIAKGFRAGGYTTGFIGKWHLAGPQPRKLVMPEYRAGFEYWMGNNCSHDNFQMNHTDTAGKLVDRRGYVPDMETDYAIDYIKANGHGRAKPFLLVVSWAPPHPGTLPPPPGFTGNQAEDGETGYYAAPKEYSDLYHDARLTRPNVKPIRMNPNAQHILSKPDVPPAAGYFGAIASLDRNMGRLLQTLKDEGLSDNTIVIFTSDHGEMMTSQGLFGKKVWWEESVGVPFMVNWKGRVKPGHCDELFNGPDIAPTLLTLAGLKPQNGMEGLDFSPAVLGRKMTGPAEIYTAMFSELQFGATAEGWRGVISKKYSYAVDGPKARAHGAPVNRRAAENGAVASSQAAPPATGPVTRYLFDLDADPYQLHPLDTSDANPVAVDLRTKLKDWLVARKDPFAELV